MVPSTFVKGKGTEGGAPGDIPQAGIRYRAGTHRRQIFTTARLRLSSWSNLCPLRLFLCHEADPPPGDSSAPMGKTRLVVRITVDSPRFSQYRRHRGNRLCRADSAADRSPVPSWMTYRTMGVGGVPYFREAYHGALERAPGGSSLWRTRQLKGVVVRDI